MARLRYEILFSPEAIEDLRRLTAHVRTEVKDRIERHLRYEPTKVSRARIKRLRGLIRPQYRLRVGDIRIFYDVTPGTVEVLVIVDKSEVDAWLEAAGIENEESGTL